MNTKNLFTFAGITYAWYAFLLTVAPHGLVDSIYPGMSYSNLNVYYGGALIGLSVACVMVRSQPLGPGVSALLVAITIEQLTSVYVHAGSFLEADITPVDVVDFAISVIVGVGGAYLLLNARKTQSAALGLVLLGTMPLAACADRPGPAVEESDGTEEHLEAFMEAFEVAWNAGNAEEIGALYAEDAIRITSSKQTPLYGRNAIVAEYANGLSTSWAQNQIDVTAVETRSLGPNLLLAIGEWRSSGADESASRNGTWINLLEESEGALRSLFDNSSSATPLWDFSTISREMDPFYTGDHSDAVDRAIVQYLGFLQGGDFAALTANSFVADGMQVMNGDMFIGVEAMIAGMELPEFGTTTHAYGYGYRPVVGDIVLAWGPYEARDAAGNIVAFGQWGNVFRLIDGELVIIAEAGGIYAG